MPKRVLAPIQKTLSGVISINARGTGYLRSQDKKLEDIEIQTANLNTALNGDLVTVAILPSRKGERTAGKVLSVDKRAKKVFVGIIQKSTRQLGGEKDFFYLSPDDKKMYVDILISKDNVITKKAEVGQKVLVKLNQWNKVDNNPTGEIIQVLGKAGEHNTEMESILYEKGFEINFPEAVEAEAEHLEKTEKPIPQSEIAKRRDFRDTITFTIDPKDAKDFDDAISFKKLALVIFFVLVESGAETSSMTNSSASTESIKGVKSFIFLSAWSAILI
jgi:ribonuclease R